MGNAAETRSEQDKSQLGLSPEEDHELRQLTWFARAGNLSERSVARLVELIGRDRRDEVRDARPNPSSPAEEVSTLPPLHLEGGPEVVCPNCGALFHSDLRAGGRP